MILWIYTKYVQCIWVILCKYWWGLISISSCDDRQTIYQKNHAIWNFSQRLFNRLASNCLVPRCLLLFSRSRGRWSRNVCLRKRYIHIQFMLTTTLYQKVYFVKPLHINRRDMRYQTICVFAFEWSLVYCGDLVWHTYMSATGICFWTIYICGLNFSMCYRLII